MDTVEGNRDSKKCLLTFIFKQSSFLYAYLLNAQTQNEVIRALDYIEDVIGLEEFKNNLDASCVIMVLNLKIQRELNLIKME